MSAHLDLDALADHLAGQGHGGDHLERCSTCHDRLAELRAADAAVVASLAALPDPAVPADLADRITAALAREPQPVRSGSNEVVASGAAPAGAAAVAAATVPVGAAPTVIPFVPRRRPTRTWLPSVAAGVVLVCGAGLGYALLGGSSSDEGTAGDADRAALGSAADSGLVRSESGVDYADPAAVAAGLPGVLAGSVGFAGELNATSGTRGDGQEPEGGSAAGGDSAPAPAAAPNAEAPEALALADPLARLRDPAGLASCLIALLPPEDPDLRPLALDYARYAGQPALAVVLPDPDPTKVSVFVVGPTCAQDNDSLLFFTRLARP